MFVIILVMLFIVCALAFIYKRSKVRVQRNATVNLTTIDPPTDPPPAYKPEVDAESSYPQPIFTIANNNSSNGRQINVGNKNSIELPPTYEEAIVISQNVSVVSRRE